MDVTVSRMREAGRPFRPEEEAARTLKSENRAVRRAVFGRDARTERVLAEGHHAGRTRRAARAGEDWRVMSCGLGGVTVGDSMFIFIIGSERSRGGQPNTDLPMNIF
jgi:hypothetical protein